MLLRVKVLAFLLVLWSFGAIALYVRLNAHTDTTGMAPPASSVVADVASHAVQPPRSLLLLLLAADASGSGALTRLLSQMGVWSGDTFARGNVWTDASNGERRDAARADKALLRAHLAKHTAVANVDRWLVGAAFNASLVPKDALNAHAKASQRAWRSLRREQPSQRSAGRAAMLFSARAALLAHQWVRAASESLEEDRGSDDEQLVCVLLWRNGVEQAREMASRNHDPLLDARFWRWMWVAQSATSLDACAGHLTLRVRHEELVAEPAAVSARVAHQLHVWGVPGATIVRDFEAAPAYRRSTASNNDNHNDAALRDAERLVLAHLRGQADSNDAHERDRLRTVLRRAVLEQRLLLRARADAAHDRAPIDLQRFYDAHVSDDNVVYALYTNRAFSVMAMNALCSADRVPALRQRFVLLALDEEVCYSMRRYDTPCVFKPFADVVKRPRQLSKEQLWTKRQGSAYQVLLVLKLAYIRDVLAAGHDVLLADADLVFLRDIARRLPAEARSRNVDLLVQSDARSRHPETDAWICAGFIFARAHARTVALFDEAIRLMQYSGAPDQDVLQVLLTGHSQWFVFNETAGTGLPPHYATAESLGVTYGTLDLRHYPNGKELDRVPFWERTKHNKMPYLVHANMRVKHKKIPDLQRHRLWFVDDESEGCNYTSWTQLPQRYLEQQQQNL